MNSTTELIAIPMSKPSLLLLSWRRKTMAFETFRVSIQAGSQQAMVIKLFKFESLLQLQLGWIGKLGSRGIGSSSFSNFA